MEAQVSMEGVVLEIIYSNDDNGYTVATIEESKESHIINIVGIMPGLSSGESISLRGSWTNHRIYGKQLSVDYFETRMPTTVTGIYSYLSSGMVKGIGETMAKRIIEKFQEKSLEIIENSPEMLLEVEGIGQKKLDMIISSYYRNNALRNIIVELSRFGLTTNQCVRIYKRFKEKTIEILKDDPYSIAEKVSGIGFKTVDAFALNMGIERESASRVDRALLYILRLAASSMGHTYLPHDRLVDEALRLLELDNVELIEDRIQNMALDDYLYLERLGDEVFVYLAQYYVAETYVCSRLVKLAADMDNCMIEGCERLIELSEEQNNIRLADNQRMAVREALTSRLMIITGGPGTGKTTTVNTIIDIFENIDMEVLLAAPTGRAAKRITETSKREAKTIHRLLEMNFDDSQYSIFLKNEEDPLSGDVLIIDEASMVDILLMYNLLKAVPDNMRVIIVGDSDQLPSVGPGNVLRDMISSSIINCVRLTEIFRQAQESLIITNAHRINRGEAPILNSTESDFFFIQRSSTADITEQLIGLVKKRLPGYLDIDSLKDIQVLAPMRKGDLGVTNLNKILQECLNPPRANRVEEKFSNRTLRVGDKVMQIRNNYEKEWEDSFGNSKGSGIYNGDIGYIYHIDKHAKEVYVIYDEEKIVRYDYDELDELDHCFATTIHKSQGSEFAAVVIPIGWGPPVLMNRNLIYTAITRAKRMVVIVGEHRHLDSMIKNNRVSSRYSNLDYRLSSLREFLED